MRVDFLSGLDLFTVIDLAGGNEILGVVWVDDTDLEYATVRVPYVFEDYGLSFDTHKVTQVSVDWVNHRIEVAHQAAQAAPWPFPTSQGKQCDACCQPETCKRIDFCAAYRCRFGQDSKP